MEPIFLTLEEIIEIHADQIGCYGGSLGIRDISLLQSALAMPQAGFGNQFLHADLFEMAAAYLYHIVRNHPFVDGNKRVGAATALVFFEMNGITPKVSNPALVQLVLDVAQGHIRKDGIADFFRSGSGS